MWVTRRVSNKKQQLPTLYDHLSLLPIFYGFRVALYVILFLLCVFTFSVPCCDLRYDFRIKKMFGSSLPLAGGLVSCIRYLCLRIVHMVSNPYCVVFLLCFSWSCVPYVTSFSGLSIFFLPLRFSLLFIERYRYRGGKSAHLDRCGLVVRYNIGTLYSLSFSLSMHY